MTPGADHISGLRRTVRHAIAKHLPRVLRRTSVLESDDACVAMLGTTLRAIMAELGPVTPAVHDRLVCVTGALLMALLRECGICPVLEYERLREAFDALNTGMLRSDQPLAWQLQHCARCVFLDHWDRANLGPAGNISLDAIEEAFGPAPAEPIDRVDELKELKARGFKVAPMCKALRISRKAFYGKWLRNVWPDDGPEANRIRNYYRGYGNTS